MKIKFYCPRWGSEALPWEVFAAKAKACGYDGVEVYPLQTPWEKPQMLEQLTRQEMEFSLLHAEMQEGKDFGRYTAALEKNLYELVTYQTAHIRPRFITSQTGREYYTVDQMAECFAICARISQETGIPIYQETHRNKWSYAAHVVKAYLQNPAFASLPLTLDLSHWVCVSESYLEDQQEAIDLAIRQARHLHARVGHPQGPQVSDPRAPENAQALQHHLQWWDQWLLQVWTSGAGECTITPEFGAYPYLGKLPYTDQPLADQWALNDWMKTLLKDRFSRMLARQQKISPADCNSRASV